ncbi:MAG: hypothetical protein HC771_01640 [Synechococcales cyanobacterium CRU_2_2]|nr:hypothetical protein [Synechococcales cyanobacterium CRU_2_2]
MDPEQRQRIIGYFLEESQEYLEQLEPGVQDLASALADPERINELYRAAHSIKGGAAMLELHGIQKVSYRLESSLKYIKGHPSIQPNAEIEASLLQGVEGLKQLIQELRATSRLSEESSAVVWQTTEPVFDQLDQILAQRVEQAEASLAEPSAPLPATAASADPAADLLLAAAAEAELLDADIFGELAANRESADNLGDFSWEDMEDLADLSDLNSAIAAKPWTTEASGDGPEVFIEGLDELANLFEENPLDSDESWSQGSNNQRPPVSVSPAVAMGEEEDYGLEDLFDDELLGTPGDGDRPVDNSEGVAEGDWLGHAPMARLFDLNDLSSEDWNEDESAIAHDLGLDDLGSDDLGSDDLGLDNLSSDGPGSDSLDSDSLG